jgi:hypothetical protein
MANPNPPVWAPNAVPTKLGWADPVTGELLLAVEGLEVEEQAPEEE